MVTCSPVRNARGRGHVVRADRGQAAAAPPARPARRAVRPALEPQHGRAEQHGGRPGTRAATAPPSPDPPRWPARRARATSAASTPPSSSWSYRTYVPWPGAIPAGIHHSLASPITWSTRMPPAWRVVAAASSASGLPCWATSQPGCHGGSVQSWPRWLNSSGGAPTLMPGTITSWRAQASAPPGCAPTARSLMTPMLMPPAESRLLRRVRLPRRQPLHPGVEVNPVGPRPPEPRHLRRTRIGQRGGPRSASPGRGPPRSRTRPPSRRARAVARAEPVEVRAAVRAERHRGDDLERRALGGPHRVPVDQRRRRARGPQRRPEGVDPGAVSRAEPGVFGDVLDAQVERAEMPPGHRQVR